MLRVCSRCGIEKDLDEFINRSDRPFGKGYRCKQCDRKRVNSVAAKRYANPKIRKQILTQKKQDHIKHRGERLAKMRTYYNNNKKSLLAKEHDYYMNNPNVQERKKKAAKVYRERKIAENPNWRKIKEMAYKIGQSFEFVEQWFNKQWMKQQAQCAICGKVFCDDDCIDHNHTTLELRGLLCNNCNPGIGFFKDSPQLCIKAAEYLKTY